ncbi:MAG: site-specific DNA-methyltransferase [Caldilineales bacterium]|nr:site-specific DNA-methyltransferase [Caldilineales bacterium]
MSTEHTSPATLFLETSLGKIYQGDSLRLLTDLEPASVDLIMTSPPFGLVRKKESLMSSTA